MCRRLAVSFERTDGLQIDSQQSPPEKAYARKSQSGSTSPKGDVTMLRYAVIFLIIAIIAAIFGFGGIAGDAAWIAKILFVVFLIIFLVSLVLGRRGPVG
jgi:uncharacterized membrane protein YtjA (UPF0391 family)